MIGLVDGSSPPTRCHASPLDQYLHKQIQLSDPRWKP